MKLHKDGIQIEVFNGADETRFKRLGYLEVVRAVQAAPPPPVAPEPEPEPDITPEAENADAIEKVNTSKAGSKTKGSSK